MDPKVRHFAGPKSPYMLPGWILLERNDARMPRQCLRMRQCYPRHANWVSENDGYNYTSAHVVSNYHSCDFSFLPRSILSLSQRHSKSIYSYINTFLPRSLELMLWLNGARGLSSYEDEWLNRMLGVVKHGNGKGRRRLWSRAATWLAGMRCWASRRRFIVSMRCKNKKR